MLITLDMAGDDPLYLQLRNQIVLGIGAGRLKEGEELPSVRQLADDLGINPMTVNKAYALLKEQGFIAIDRRHGAKINVLARVNPHFPKMWQEQLALLISEALARDMSKKEFEGVCECLYEEIIKGGG